MSDETLHELCPGTRLHYVSDTWGLRPVSSYELGDAIGEGTYGKVFKAAVKRISKAAPVEPVALKMMVRHHEDEGFPKTETREIKILKAVRHPNMVNLREVVSSLSSEVIERAKLSASILGTSTAAMSSLYDRMGDVYMVFDYVDYDLAGLIESGFMFATQHVKCIAYQLLQVLDYLHSHPQRFVHRDLKCSNLLLTDDNVVKLGDFGLARSLIQYDPTAKLSNTVITLWYRAPEVLLGATDYTAAVDMWSVGCIIVELLTSRPAFPARQEAEQVKNVFRVIGTPSEGSYLRTLPLWRKFEIEERTSQLTAWLHRSERLRDPELTHLISRMLEGDPTKRITAREALSASWFSSAPKIDKDYPNAGIPRISATTGFVVGLDHHEFAAKQRRKVLEIAKQSADPGADPLEPYLKVLKEIPTRFDSVMEAAAAHQRLVDHRKQILNLLDVARSQLPIDLQPRTLGLLSQHLGQVDEYLASASSYLAESRAVSAPAPMNAPTASATTAGTEAAIPISTHRSRSRDVRRWDTSPREERSNRRDRSFSDERSRYRAVRDEEQERGRERDADRHRRHDRERSMERGRRDRDDDDRDRHRRTRESERDRERRGVEHERDTKDGDRHRDYRLSDADSRHRGREEHHKERERSRDRHREGHHHHRDRSRDRHDRERHASPDYYDRHRDDGRRGDRERDRRDVDRRHSGRYRSSSRDRAGSRRR